MKTTTTEQIACVRREIALRQRVFPRKVEKGEMSREQSERELAAMEDILERLRLTDEGEAESCFPFLCLPTTANP